MSVGQFTNVSIENKEDTLFGVSWTSDYTQSVKKTLPLQVKRTYGYPYFYYFEFSCNFMWDAKTEPNQIAKGSIQLHFKQASGKSDGSTSTDEGDAIPDYYREPCDIWMTVPNAVEKYFLHRSSSSSEWKTEIISIASPHRYQETFSRVLWIKFNSSGMGEINATKRLTQLFVQQTRCDVQFTFENGKHIGGHVAILSASSNVFEAMLSNDMVEAKTGKVFIQDIKPKFFKEMLHYIYAGRTLAPLTEITAQPMYKAAEKYDIQDLAKECINFLVFHVQKKNAIDLIIWADIHSIDKIKDAALKFVAENFRIICQTTQWEELVKNHTALCLLVTRMI